MLTRASIAYAYLPAYLITFVIWVVAPDQMVWIALVLFLIFLPVRLYDIRTVEIPREKWQAHVKANTYQQLQDHWPDARVIKVRGYAFAESGHPMPKYPTLFVPADSPVLSNEIIVESDWQIDEFNFLNSNLYLKDRTDLNIYLTVRLRVGSKRFILPIAVAKNVLDKLELNNEGVRILQALNEAQHASFTAFDQRWTEALRRGKYRRLSLLGRSKRFYDDVMSPNKHYSLEIPPPSLQALETYIANHEMALLSQSSFTPDQSEATNISFSIRDYRIEYVPQDKKLTIHEKILRFLFMPLPPFPNLYQ